MRDNEMELLLRSFDEELDAGDRLALETLLEASVEARAAHDRVRRLRGLVARSATDAFEPHFADRVMALVEEDIRPDEQGAPRRRAHQEEQRMGLRGALPRKNSYRTRARSGSWQIVTGLAAAALVVTAVGLAVWLQPRTVTVPYGATEMVELSDGSVAELSSGSSLTYRNFWGRDERRVTLEGEAFFDVEEAQRPFIVETFNATIEVVGTRFNVSAWSTDPVPQTSVALESGRVAVSPRQTSDERRALSTEETAAAESAAAESATGRRAASEPVVLEPGQGTLIVGDTTAVRPPTFITLDHVVAWRSGGLAFVDQPVGSAFRTIERRFNVDVDVTDQNIQGRLLTYLNPHPRSAEDVLSDICHTLDLRYRHTANGFEILPSDML